METCRWPPPDRRTWGQRGGGGQADARRLHGCLPGQELL